MIFTCCFCCYVWWIFFSFRFLFVVSADVLRNALEPILLTMRNGQTAALSLVPLDKTKYWKKEEIKRKKTVLYGRENIHDTLRSDPLFKRCKCRWLKLSTCELNVLVALFCFYLLFLQCKLFKSRFFKCIDLFHMWKYKMIKKWFLILFFL